MHSHHALAHKCVPPFPVSNASPISTASATRRVPRTGAIWNEQESVRAEVVREVCNALERSYGKPRLGNPEDPLDDLIYIIVSNKTSAEVASRTYARLKATFGRWDNVVAAPAPSLRTILAPAGLSTVKSQQIRSALGRIASDFGSCDVTALRGWQEQAVLAYLTSLPGVSEKVARCVMMYTLDYKVLPVDAHVHRVAKRLGWVNRKRADQCHDELEALIEPDRRYAFHVDCIVHGRVICRPVEPACHQCPVVRYCDFGRSRA